MRILIAAAGSIGTIVGVLLAKNHEVTLLRRSMALDGNNVTSVTVHGGFDFSSELTIINWDNLGDKHDIVYLASQGQDTQEVITQLKPILDKSTPIVSLQNGIRNGQIIRNILPNNPIILASLWWGGTLTDPTTVFYNRVANTWIGIPAEDKGNLRYEDALTLVHQQLKALPEGSFNCKISENIDEILYQKLAYNILAPASALIKSSNFLSDDKVRKLAHRMFEEGINVIEKKGYPSNSLEGMHKFLASDPNPTQETPETPWKSSTQISAEKYGGRGSNTDIILGELERLGAEVDVKTPAISLVKSTIERFQPYYKPLRDDELQQLLTSLGNMHCSLVMD